MTVLDQLPDGARVVVIRLRSLGDIVLTTPALSILKQHRPDLHLSVAVEPRFRGLLEGNPDVDEILDDTLLAARRARPNLCINFHGGNRSLKMTLACGLAKTVGFGHFPLAVSYGICVPRAQEILGEERAVHTAEHLASAMFYLGARRVPIPRARLFTSERPETGEYAVLHPFASHRDKMWPAEKFAELALRFERELGLRAIILAGPGDDIMPFSSLHRVHQGAPLETVKGVLKHAALFTGNDSGPAHMAAAFGVPVTVLFGTSDEKIWGPWRTESRVLTGLEKRTVNEVFAAAAELRSQPA